MCENLSQQSAVAIQHIATQVLVFKHIFTVILWEQFAHIGQYFPMTYVQILSTWAGKRCITCPPGSVGAPHSGMLDGLDRT
jgi:hypothetical protein